jgi:asparagine synthase (glutamine-hydrolysing)
MCGIAGEVRFDGARAELGVVERMSAAMAARGPDASGLLAHDAVALGHRRLRVIDTSERARQPMTAPETGLSIVFNGAIYNHRELRRELEAEGQRFFSDGDTEVVLRAVAVWGPSCVEKLGGMFAFAVHDRESGRVWLARDRLGIKPLYLAERPGRLRFASSLPALLAGGGIDTAIDPRALAEYLSFHAVVPAPRTILCGVRKLPPATLLTIEPDGRRSARTYWEASFDPDPESASMSFADHVERVRDELRAAVRRRLCADVPVGVLLSGGLDSSLVVGLLAEAGQTGLRTFSVGFDSVGDERGDEFEYSDLVAERFATEHQRIAVPPDRTLGALDATIAAMSEPMVSHDCVGFWLLSEAVSRHVKVVQSGQGADELFGGYHWYPPLLDSTAPVDDYLRVFRDRDPEELRRGLGGGFALDGDPARELVEAQFARPGASRPIDKALRLDTTVMLTDDPVKRVDNMTMAHGLEARVPFLDHHLVELVARIPAEHKVGHGGKHVLKEAARTVIPAEVIDRPKGYFPVPALKFLRGAFLERVRGVLLDPRCRRRGLFAPGYVDELLRAPDEHLTPLRGSKLWQCALLENWLTTHGL